MSDRELLELAAKAAGLDLVWHADEVDEPWPFIDAHVRWNPLISDGDALRLAVGLHMRFENWTTCVQASVARHSVMAVCEESYHRHDGDELAATRKAIVLAASEIGRDMQSKGQNRVD